ncbi:MAG: FAD-dependent oxidoreductase [Planctomycetia bacterium]
MRVIVLGAGLAGLSAAVRAAREGASVLVLEAGGRVGGLASSIRVDGWWLDHGPHRFWSRDERTQAFARQMLAGNLVESERRSQIVLLGRRFEYPLQPRDALSKLPARVLARACFDWAVERARHWIDPRPDADFEDWVVKRFGRTLHELFFGQYTEKAWGVPCSEISADWAAQRISQTGLLDAAASMLLPSRGARQRSLAARFLYPREGGIGALSESCAAHLRELGGELAMEARVERLELRRGRVRAVHARRADGGVERFECDALVSTIPLPRLLDALVAGKRGADAAGHAGLCHRAVRFVHLEVARPRLSRNHWIYLPERELAAHRATEFKNFSEHGLPVDRTAVCVEFTCAKGDAVWSMPERRLALLAESDLAKVGLLSRGESRLLATQSLEHAYPVYDLGYKRRVDAALAVAKSVQNLRTTGRQGLHRYNNMDHSLAMGWHAAKGLARACGHAPSTREARADERVASEPRWFG